MRKDADIPIAGRREGLRPEAEPQRCRTITKIPAATGKDKGITAMPMEGKTFLVGCVLQPAERQFAPTDRTQEQLRTVRREL